LCRKGNEASETLLGNQEVGASLMPLERWSAGALERWSAMLRFYGLSRSSSASYRFFTLVKPPMFFQWSPSACADNKCDVTLIVTLKQGFS
jgi:hypothetical protein